MMRKIRDDKQVASKRVGSEKSSLTENENVKILRNKHIAKEARW